MLRQIVACFRFFLRPCTRSSEQIEENVLIAADEPRRRFDGPCPLAGEKQETCDVCTRLQIDEVDTAVRMAQLTRGDEEPAVRRNSGTIVLTAAWDFMLMHEFASFHTPNETEISMIDHSYDVATIGGEHEAQKSNIITDVTIAPEPSDLPTRTSVNDNDVSPTPAESASGP